jgi:hypothetical protein
MRADDDARRRQESRETVNRRPGIGIPVLEPESRTIGGVCSGAGVEVCLRHPREDDVRAIGDSGE